MREKQTSHKTMARESDIINVDDSSSYSSDSAASIGGVPNHPSNQASLENHMPPPPNPPSRLVASQHFSFGLQ